MSGWQKDDANAKQSRIDAGQTRTFRWSRPFQQQADRYRQMSQQYAAFRPDDC
jgi:GH25 family lysozyme M1 (1,4-beta-N-acetylmuramidase)